MPRLSEIHGQSRAIAQLVASWTSGRLHHAFLFDGPPGVGKATVARAFAQALNCERPVQRQGAAVDACGVCNACHKIDTGVHPDLIAFDMTPKGLTERVRDLIAPLAYLPHEGKERIVVLDPADDLAGAGGKAEAANALLKTLEEPPARTRFVLVTAQSRRLPVTVRSRCQTVRFAPLPEATIASLLVAQHGVDPAAAPGIAARCDGSLGAAIASLQAGDGERLDGQVDALLAAIERGDRLGILTCAQRLGAEREDALLAMQIAERKLRDRLVGDADEANPVLSLAMWRALREAAECLRGNVAPVLVLEHAGLQVANLGVATAAPDGANR